ncbi:hypothetical protein LguiB_005929 [Lonicera macranthoides]
MKKLWPLKVGQKSTNREKSKHAIYASVSTRTTRITRVNPSKYCRRIEPEPRKSENPQLVAINPRNGEPNEEEDEHDDDGENLVDLDQLSYKPDDNEGDSLEENVNLTDSVEFEFHDTLDIVRHVCDVAVKNIKDNGFQSQDKANSPLKLHSGTDNHIFQNFVLEEQLVDANQRIKEVKEENINVKLAMKKLENENEVAKQNESVKDRIEATLNERLKELEVKSMSLSFMIKSNEATICKLQENVSQLKKEKELLIGKINGFYNIDERKYVVLQEEILGLRASVLTKDTKIKELEEINLLGDKEKEKLLKDISCLNVEENDLKILIDRLSVDTNSKDKKIISMQSCIELLKNEKKNLEQHVQDLERVQLEAKPDQFVTPIPVLVLPIEEKVIDAYTTLLNDELMREAKTIKETVVTPSCSFLASLRVVAVYHIIMLGLAKFDFVGLSWGLIVSESSFWIFGRYSLDLWHDCAVQAAVPWDDTLCVASRNETDSLALLAFKSNLHDPQGVLNSWNSSVNFCNWQGITCGLRHRRVTVLNLSSSGLVGSLSPNIGNLSFLRHIALQNNSLQGQLPPEIGRLFRLESLYLYNNSLEGKIPTNLSHCRNLMLIAIGNNKLVGEIPRELTTLSNLIHFSVYSNYLRGEIWSSFGNLTSLEHLSLAYNALEGSIPNTFGQLIKLRFLGIGANEISGMVPSSMYNLSLLTTLSLAGNQLRGIIPNNLGLSLPYLQALELAENQFTGAIPASLTNVSELGLLQLSSNKFTGNIPTNFGSLQNLQSLLMHSNFLGNEEADDMAFLNSLTNCSALEVLEASNNQLGGVLPNSLGNLSTHMRLFHVAINKISGVIPSGFGGLVNLEMLGIEQNQFEGEIPDVIGEMKKLQLLDLSRNRLFNKIPTSLGNLSFLSRLLLQDNKLEGTIPSSLGNCKNLISLDLSQNNLSGNIPKELFNVSALSISVNLAQNSLVGPLPSEVGNLGHLGELDVSKNRLSGEIPTELGKCSSLVNLNLSGNFFEGSIPPSFESLKGVQNLDISSNNLSGIVPIFLASFSLESLNLSFNNFEGELPINGVFANVRNISVVGNNGLCGGISTLQLPQCKTRTLKEQGLSRFHIILISGGCLLLVVFMVSLFIICWLKKKKLRQSSRPFPVESFLTVSYGDLLKATDGFSSTNLIGMGSFGSVYKGILDQEEKTVAVKVLNLLRQGASKSFMAECEALRNIRHRNLVKIITSCSSIDFQGNDFKALVYEFMPNGSLERWLNSSQDTDNGQDEHHILNLHQRINISMDVACALEYLHFRCEKPIVHCDLKPSNILLDIDMVAHVGDFGLAKFILPELSNANQSSSNGIRGTVGYIAPEYGLGGEVSMNGDVYSYGILLLEMVTGRSPIDPMFNEGLNLHNFAKMALPDHVKEIVEPKLLSNNEEVETAPSNNTQSSGQSRNSNTKEDCLISMVKVGVACSMESPQDRMDLNQVIRELYSIKSILSRT